MRLKTRIKIITVSLTLLVLLLNTVIILPYIFGQLKNNSEQYMESINIQKLATAENLMDTIVTMTQKPLLDTEILTILREDYSDYPKESRKYEMYQDIDIMNDKLYTEMFYQNEYVYAVTLITEDGESVYSKQRSGRGVLNINFKELDWYRRLHETDGKDAVLFPLMREDLYRGEEPIIAWGKLLMDPRTNQPLGIIRIDIAVKDLENVWGANEFGDDAEILFRDEDGELLYTTLDSKNWQEEYEKLLKNNIEVRTYSDKYGFSATSLLPENIVYEKAYITMLIILAVAVICILLAVFLSEFVARMIEEPIGKLNILLKEVKSGNLQVRAKVTEAPGEFEEVCGSFNDMVENMERLIYQVRVEENEKAKAQYQALQAQISPHFILNTINTIKWMSIIQGNKSIEKALDSFARLLEFAARRKEELIPIREELKQMEYYIDILSLRYYNKFSIEFDVEEEVKRYGTIKFLLQTIVENSVFHGFGTQSELGKIHVGIHKINGDILYEVEDDGKGIAQERIEQILNHSEPDKRGMVKIGIYNINRRIKLIFGKEYGVSIESQEGKYTIVRVKIPAREAEDGDSSSC